jgi:hypothetical protein
MFARVSKRNLTQWTCGGNAACIGSRHYAEEMPSGFLPCDCVDCICAILCGAGSGNDASLPAIVASADYDSLGARGRQKAKRKTSAESPGRPPAVFADQRCGIRHGIPRHARNGLAGAGFGRARSSGKAVYAPSDPRLLRMWRSHGDGSELDCLEDGPVGTLAQNPLAATDSQHCGEHLGIRIYEGSGMNARFAFG